MVAVGGRRKRGEGNKKRKNFIKVGELKFSSTQKSSKFSVLPFSFPFCFGRFLNKKNITGIKSFPRRTMGGGGGGERVQKKKNKKKTN